MNPLVRLGSKKKVSEVLCAVCVDSGAAPLLPPQRHLAADSAGSPTAEGGQS